MAGMTAPMIVNPAEGGLIAVTWAKHPGAKGEDVRFGDDDPVTPGEQNADGSNRTRKVIAGVSGTVTSVGGTFGEVVIKIDNDPLGRSVRTAENATIHVGKGQHVDHFTVVAEGALFRKDAYFPKGAYRDLHINGVASNGARIQFGPMVTHTQAAARAALSPKPLAANARQVLAGANARRRKTPSLAGTVMPPPLTAGSVHTPEGFAYGEDGSGLFYVIGGLYSHGSTFTESSPHDLPNLTPALPVPPAEPEPVEPPAPEPEEPETGPIVVPEPPAEPVEPEEPPVVVTPEPEPPVVVEPPVVEPETPTPTPAPADSPWATIGAIILAVAGFIAGIVAWFNA